MRWLITFSMLFCCAAHAATNQIFLFPAQPIKAVRVQRGTNDVAVRFLNSTNAVRPFVLYRKRGTNWQAFQTNAVVGKHITAEKVAEAMVQIPNPNGEEVSQRSKKQSP